MRKVRIHLGRPGRQHQLHACEGWRGEGGEQKIAAIADCVIAAVCDLVGSCLFVRLSACPLVRLAALLAARPNAKGHALQKDKNSTAPSGADNYSILPTESWVESMWVVSPAADHKTRVSKVALSFYRFSPIFFRFTYVCVRSLLLGFTFLPFHVGT